MQDYRIYRLNPHTGQITGAEELRAPDDDAAIHAARAALRDVPVELWAGGRKLLHLAVPPEAAAFVEPRLGEALA